MQESSSSERRPWGRSFEWIFTTFQRERRDWYILYTRNMHCPLEGISSLCFSSRTCVIYDPTPTAAFSGAPGWRSSEKKQKSDVTPCVSYMYITRKRTCRVSVNQARTKIMLNRHIYVCIYACIYIYIYIYIYYNVLYYLKYMHFENIVERLRRQARGKATFGSQLEGCKRKGPRTPTIVLSRSRWIVRYKNEQVRRQVYVAGRATKRVL